MANNVSLAGHHCYNEWHMEMVGYKAEYPAIHRETVSIPGRDGKIDITEGLFGRTIYGNRKITIQLENHRLDVNESFADFESRVLNDIHGVKGQVIFEDDPGYFFVGTMQVTALNDNEGIWEMEVVVDADPYKYLISDPTQKKL